MAPERRTITLSNEQYRLLDLYMAAIGAEPEAALFTCMRMERIDFAWIIHPGFYNDVRMAHWDDMLELERLGLIVLYISDPDSRECSFRLAPIAGEIHARGKTAQRSDTSVTVSIDDDI